MKHIKVYYASNLQRGVSSVLYYIIICFKLAREREREREKREDNFGRDYIDAIPEEMEESFFDLRHH